MKMKIVADGGAGGTIVTADGRDLNGSLVGVTFRHAAGELPTIDVELAFAQIEAEGEAKVLVANPGTGELQEVASIAFADGSVWPD